MTRVLFITVFLMYSFAFSQDKTTSGTFSFETEIIDYGNIAQNSEGKRIFTFKNSGNSPITIKSVKGSCGCTVPTKPEKAVLPGETATIEVTYDTKRIGGFSKTITIISNASNERKVLRIKGNVMKKDLITSISKS